jgi:hypothetical protein
MRESIAGSVAFKCETFPTEARKNSSKTEFYADEHEGLFCGSMVRMVVQSTSMLA